MSKYIDFIAYYTYFALSSSNYSTSEHIANFLFILVREVTL